MEALDALPDGPFTRTPIGRTRFEQMTNLVEMTVGRRLDSLAIERAVWS